MSFFAKLEARVEAINSLLCVGLDPHEKELFPNGVDGVIEQDRADAAFTFCKTLIDATGKWTLPPPRSLGYLQLIALVVL
jgi:orotidine-5'-phosphate decarboxylase